MSKFREAPCKYYICKGECEKGKDAEYKGLCQHCTKYEPRAKVKSKNRKKEYNENERGKIYQD
jgi:hypothetical protein